MQEAGIRYDFPKRVLIWDETLRDGEQTPGVYFTPEEKLELTKLFESIRACKLAQAGDWLAADPLRRKGEFVLIVEGAAGAKAPAAAAARTVLAALLEELPLKKAVALAARITGGRRNGSSSSGSMSSANRVRTVMAAKTVPTATNPRVASTAVTRIQPSAPRRSTPKNSTKSGSATASTTNTNPRLARYFPRNRALRESGASRSPSSAAFSCSRANDRLSAMTAENVKVIHNTLGAIASRETAAASRAKLKTTRTSAAKAIATAAVLSRGRVTLTLGVGWSNVEYTLLGQDFKTRGKRTDEMIEVLRKLWNGQMISHEGSFYRFDALESNPRPPAPIPIWVGGISDAALRRAARNEGWLSDLQSTSEIEACIDKVRRFREEQGRAAQPFDVMASASDAFTLEGYRRLAKIGVTQP